MGAKKKPLDTVGAGDVGIDAGRVGADGSAGRSAATSRRRRRRPPARSSRTRTPNETVEKIVAWLDERKLI